MHDYRQKTGFVHLQKFIGGKLLCCKDHWLISQIDPCMGATHGADQQLGDLPDIFDLFFDSLRPPACGTHWQAHPWLSGLRKLH